MKLAEIRKILLTTGASDWNHVKGYPTYRDNLGPLSDGDPVSSHHGVAVYRQDVRLTLAWGMDPPGDDNPHDPAVTTWWTSQARISSFLVDVFYCGSLVDRHVGANVDSAACLPYPRPHGFADISEYRPPDPPPIGWSVTRWQVEFFRLIHGFDHRPDVYDSCINRAGFVIDESGDE